MDIYGLVGLTLKHSFSQSYFRNKFINKGLDADYLNFELAEISEIKNLILNTPNLKGLNITLPYKEKIIPYLDDLSADAHKIGAVNTVKIENTSGKKKLKGFNTDSFGFKKSIEPFLESHHKNALIFGSGGASKSVAYVLKSIGVNYKIVSRSIKGADYILYPNLSAEIIREHKVLINTTPLGMYPNTSDFPDIPYSYISSEHLMYDLIYNPTETVFLKNGKQKGAVTINGKKMLELQAEKSWEIWNS